MQGNTARAQPSEVTDNDLSPEEQALFDAQRDDAPEPTPAVIEPTPDPAAVAEQEAARPRDVPVAVLQEERERRKKAEADAEAANQRLRTLEERTNILLQNLGKPQEAAPQATASALPDPAVDPVGHILGKLQQFEGTLSAMQGTGRQAQEQVRQAELRNTLIAQGQAAEQTFRAETPDYDAAAAHLRAHRDRELAMMGFADPVARAQQLNNEALQITAMALQQRKNPAQLFYEMAGLRGYQKKAAEAEAPAAAADPAPATQRLETLAAGRRAGNSALGSTGGRGPVPLTAQRLAEMPLEEFARVVQTREGLELLGMGA